MTKMLRFALIALMSFSLALTGLPSWAVVEPVGDRPAPIAAEIAAEPASPAESLPESEPAEAEVPEASPEAPEDSDLPADPSADPLPAETDAEAEEATDAKAAEAYDPEVWFQRELLIEADRLYLAGDIAAAEDLYREAKTFGWRDDSELELPPEPFTEEDMLSPGAAVYWRESARGVEADRESQALIPLKLLTEAYPAFIPGHLRYVELLLGYERPDEAEAVLQQALTVYPANPVLLQAQVDLMMQREQWIEASIAARQFALLNEEHPEASQYSTLADQNLDRFKSATNAQIRNNAIANVLTGVAGYVLTGGIFGPFTALNSTLLLLQGESAVGTQVANQAQQQLPMLEDEAVLTYVRDMGQTLAAVAGRDEFDYAFHVILDEDINAFALPGGKVFVNAGAIMETKSEAELAGLLAHEISHAVLSHGFQLVTQGNLTASVTQYLPLPGLITNILVNGYSRQMERQADIVGTQILASSGYAADGMHGLMVALQEEYGDRQIPAWLSSHPAPQERVDYLQALVERGGYNRYAYEGVATHEAIQLLTAQALEAHKAEQEADEVDIEDAVEEVKEEQDEAIGESGEDSADSETVTPETP